MAQLLRTSAFGHHLSLAKVLYMFRYFVLVLTLMSFVACTGRSSKPRYVKKQGYQRYTNIEDLIFSYGQEDADKNHSKKYSSRKFRAGAHDIPITVNPLVNKWIDYFTGKGRGSYARWISRSGRYFPYYYQVLEKYGVPKDIVYLSFIESGLNTRSTSSASAAGPWQFIRSTGALYGLRSDYYIDERRDIPKATHAAVRHLKDLYNEFGDWYLAFGAYNAGSGKINRAIRMYGTRDFWQMSDAGNYLRAETKNYVPKILAAAIIGHNLKRYGFTNINYQEPLAKEQVTITRSTSLTDIANAAGVHPDVVYLINPELYRGVTPPYAYKVYLPKGTAKVFARNFNSRKYQSAVQRKIVVHKVKHGETLNHIASKYGVSKRDIMASNDLNAKSRLKRGKKLKITVLERGWSQQGASFRDDQAALMAKNRWGTGSGLMLVKSNERQRPSSLLASVKQDEVKKDQPKNLSKKYQKAIAKQEEEKKNNKDVQSVGTKLASLDLSDKPQSDGETSFKPVNENLGEIPVANSLLQPAVARSNVDQENPSSTGTWSNENSQASIGAVVIDLAEEKKPESDLEVEKPAPILRPKPVKRTAVFHRVRKGENLTRLAERYGTTVAQLRKLNGSDLKPLKVGQSIKIKSGSSDKVVNSSRVTQNSSSPSLSIRHHKVSKGETLIGISRKYGVPVSKLKEINGPQVTQLKYGQTIKIKGGKQNIVEKSKVRQKTYVIKKGDTLSNIARSNGLSVQQLMKLNGMKSTKITVGKRIKVNS